MRDAWSILCLTRSSGRFAPRCLIEVSRCLPIPSRPGLCILHTVDCDGRHSDSDERPLRFHVADPMWSAASLAQSVFYPDAERELLSHLSDQ